MGYLIMHIYLISCNPWVTLIGFKNKAIPILMRFRWKWQHIYTIAFTFTLPITFKISLGTSKRQ